MPPETNGPGTFLFRCVTQSHNPLNHAKPNESGADAGSASSATWIGQVLDEGAFFVQLFVFTSLTSQPARFPEWFHYKIRSPGSKYGLQARAVYHKLSLSRSESLLDTIRSAFRILNTGDGVMSPT